MATKKGMTSFSNYMGLTRTFFKGRHRPTCTIDEDTYGNGPPISMNFTYPSKLFFQDPGSFLTLAEIRVRLFRTT